MDDSEAPITTDKFLCPVCQTWKSRVMQSRPDAEGLRFLRLRQCVKCGQLYKTGETVLGVIDWHDVPATGPDAKGA